jgi:hypothetical protein
MRADKGYVHTRRAALLPAPQGRRCDLQECQDIPYFPSAPCATGSALSSAVRREQRKATVGRPTAKKQPGQETRFDPAEQAQEQYPRLQRLRWPLARNQRGLLEFWNIVATREQFSGLASAQ